MDPAGSLSVVEPPIDAEGDAGMEAGGAEPKAAEAKGAEATIPEEQAA